MIKQMQSFKLKLLGTLMVMVFIVQTKNQRMTGLTPVSGRCPQVLYQVSAYNRVWSHTDGLHTSSPCAMTRASFPLPSTSEGSCGLDGKHRADSCSCPDSLRPHVRNSMDLRCHEENPIPQSMNGLGRGGPLYKH